MSSIQESVKILVASTQRLAEMDPKDDAIARSVKNLEQQVSMLREQLKGSRSWSKNSMEHDIEFLQEEIKRLRSAAEIPLNNWKRINTIIEGLQRVAALASRPQNSELAPKIKELTIKIAGLFQEVDTSADLDRPLEQIQDAVSKLYGPDLNDPMAYMFEKRNKGHHEKRYDKDPYTKK
jgi:type I site-specific restriction endonuclease